MSQEDAEKPHVRGMMKKSPSAAQRSSKATQANFRHSLETLGLGLVLLCACSDGGAADHTNPVGRGGDAAGGSSTAGAADENTAGMDGLNHGGGSAGASMNGTAGAHMDGSAGGDTGGSAGGNTGGSAGSNIGGNSGGNAGSGGASAGSGGMGAENPPTTCTPARPHEAGTTTVDITHDEILRDYVLHVPPGYDGSERLPLVMDLHGFSSFGMEQLERSRWDGMADEENFIVIYPDGVDRRWNSSAGTDDNDVRFLRSVVEHVSANLCIDEKRVYATGHSNGGGMTYRLGCEAADMFAAIAPVCGVSSDPECDPARPIPVLAIRSLEDPTVKYETAQADVDKWLALNECENTPFEPSHNGVCNTYTACAAGTQVMECHPHGRHGFYYRPAENTDNLWIPDAAWPFFKQFALP